MFSLHARKAKMMNDETGTPAEQKAQAERLLNAHLEQITRLHEDIAALFPQDDERRDALKRAFYDYGECHRRTQISIFELIGNP